MVYRRNMLRCGYFYRNRTSTDTRGAPYPNLDEELPSQIFDPDPELTPYVFKNIQNVYPELTQTNIIRQKYTLSQRKTLS